MEELKTMTGTCQFCGQTKILRTEDQEQADRMATESCDCPGGKIAKREKLVSERLDELIGELAPENNWDPVDPEAYEKILDLAYMIVEGKMESVVIRIDHTNLKVRNSGGKIIVERSKSVKQGGNIEQ